MDSVAFRAFFVGIETTIIAMHWQVEQLSLFADRCQLNKENWSKVSKPCRTMYIVHLSKAGKQSVFVDLRKSFRMWTFIPTD